MRNFIRKLYRSKNNITKKEMKFMLENYPNVVLLDVRSPQEFAEGHLDNAINIPNYEIYSKAPRILTNKETIIIAYCTVGIRSENAIRILRRLGYKNLYHLEGGIER